MYIYIYRERERYHIHTHTYGTSRHSRLMQTGDGRANTSAEHANSHAAYAWQLPLSGLGCQNSDPGDSEPLKMARSSEEMLGNLTPTAVPKAYQPGKSNPALDGGSSKLRSSCYEGFGSWSGVAGGLQFGEPRSPSRLRAGLLSSRSAACRDVVW